MEEYFYAFPQLIAIWNLKKKKTFNQKINSPKIKSEPLIDGFFYMFFWAPDNGWSWWIAWVSNCQWFKQLKGSQRYG